MTCSQITKLAITAAVTAAGLGATAVIAACGTSGQSPRATAAVVAPASTQVNAQYSYSYYRSMMRSHFGSGSMMGGGSYGWMMGPAGYRWMTGAHGVPGWAAGHSSPGHTGRKPDPGRCPRQHSSTHHYLHHRQRSRGSRGQSRGRPR